MPPILFGDAEGRDHSEFFRKCELLEKQKVGKKMRRSGKVEILQDPFIAALEDG